MSRIASSSTLVSELGECSAAAVAALRHLDAGPNTVLVATEGVTGAERASLEP
jgi:hypothetical protein